MTAPIIGNKNKRKNRTRGRLTVRFADQLIQNPVRNSRLNVSATPRGPPAATAAHATQNIMVFNQQHHSTIEPPSSSSAQMTNFEPKASLGSTGTFGGILKRSHTQPTQLPFGASTNTATTLISPTAAPNDAYTLVNVSSAMAANVVNSPLMNTKLPSYEAARR